MTKKEMFVQGEERYSCLGVPCGVLAPHRRNIYEWIRKLATEIAYRAGKLKITIVEWRVAVKQWLLKND